MIEERLKELKIQLPEAAKPSFNYLPVTLHNGVAYVSGQLPKIDGEARACALQGLACLKDAIGSLDKVERILKVNGYVASAPGFNAQPRVLDAASELLVEIFGEKGRHARAAVGVAELPRNAVVEVELTVAFRD